ncbi:MAG: hypothetical protein GX546_03120 [Acholeplasmataceae bacterium]|jgi:hypothetical protein|nr:hypothetical protein [Acholeplasmataceae bacterium]
MNRKDEFLNNLLGLKLNRMSLMCEMMVFDFGNYGLHCQALTRIRKNNDILFTTYDYQSWDQKVSKNNDEWYFFERYKSVIEGGIVKEISSNEANDLFITMDNGIFIDVIVANGYFYYDDDKEQWRLLCDKENDSLHMVVYNKQIVFSDKDKSA